MRQKNKSADIFGLITSICPRTYPPTHHCKCKFHSWHPSAACVGILTRPAWHCFGLFIVTDTSAPHPRFDGFSRPRELVKRSSRHAPLVDLRAPGLLSEAIFTFFLLEMSSLPDLPLRGLPEKKGPAQLQLASLSRACLDIVESRS